MCRRHPIMITLSLTLQALRNTIRELLPSDPELALQPGQSLDHPVSISRALVHSAGGGEGVGHRTARWRSACIGSPLPSQVEGSSPAVALLPTSCGVDGPETSITHVYIKHLVCYHVGLIGPDQLLHLLSFGWLDAWCHISQQLSRAHVIHGG